MFLRVSGRNGLAFESDGRGFLPDYSRQSRQAGPKVGIGAAPAAKSTLQVGRKTQARLLSPNVRTFVDVAAPALRERLATRN